ncbi:MAG: hypothetical protein ACYTDY_12115 [Planctomycetota bacterium]|jgi:hypothetical protein
MRVVVVTESPDADETTRQFLEAAEAYNRGLDIRLRFLDVGFELRTIAVRPGEPAPAVALEETLLTFRPGVVLVLGTSPRILECAAAAAKAHLPIAFLHDGGPEGSATAIARIAQILILGEECRPPAARPGALVRELPPDGAPGAALVDILVRSVRERRVP